MKPSLSVLRALLLLVGLGACGTKETAVTKPPQVLVAVASNFAPTLETLSEAFTASSGIQIESSVGSTGKHAVQIRQGAPFDIFLAADATHPRNLEAEGHGIAATRFTYARGRLMLWSLNPNRVVDATSLEPSEILDRGANLAIANPELAPYGFAAQQFLQQQGLWEDYPGLRVMGENVGQAYRFARSGHAAMALVAASQVAADPQPEGHGWLVPADAHDPILQQALLLRDTPEARAFLTFLRSGQAATILLAHGYEVPEQP